MSSPAALSTGILLFRKAMAVRKAAVKVMPTATLLSLLLNRGIGDSIGVCLRTVLADWEPPDLTDFEA